MGRTDSDELQKLIDGFAARIARYVPFRMEFLPDVRQKGKPEVGRLQAAEAEKFRSALRPSDTVWLLDEKGKQPDSRGFATQLQKAMNAGPKRLVLVIGGAYGFDPSLRERADGSVSLSRMTFNHQVVRLMAVEQIYRGFSILRGDPYHND